MFDLQGALTVAGLILLGIIICIAIVILTGCTADNPVHVQSDYERSVSVETEDNKTTVTIEEDKKKRAQKGG